MVRNILLDLFFLVVLASACLNPNQKDGECKKCRSIQILEQGRCYAKLNGCLIQKATKCQTCQNGYVLNKQSCKRSAEFFNKTDLNPAPSKFDEINIKPLSIRYMILKGFIETKDILNPLYLAARKKLVEEYPNLQSFNFYKTQEKTLNNSSMNFLLYIIDVNTDQAYLARVLVNSKLESKVTEIYKDQNSIQKKAFSTELLGIIWETYTNLSNPNFIQAKKKLLASQPQLQKYDIKKVQYQNGAGFVFQIQFTSKQFEKNTLAKVYLPLYGDIKIIAVQQIPKTAIEKPNQLIVPPIKATTTLTQKADETYSYKKDPIFTDLFKDFQSQIKESTLPAISQVERLESKDGLYVLYKIIFSEDNFAIVQYYPKYLIFQINSYIVNKFQTWVADSQRTKVKELNDQQLITALELLGADKFIGALIKSKSVINISIFTSIYDLHVFTPSGNYFISLLDRGSLSIIKLQQVSKTACFQINIRNPTSSSIQQSIVEQIKDILLSRFSLSEYELTSVFVKASNNKTSQYVLFWSRVDLRKIKISMEIKLNKLIIKKLSFLNNGMYVAKEDNAALLMESMAKRKFAELKNTEKLLTITNGSLYQIDFTNSTHILTIINKIPIQTPTITVTEIGKSVACPQSLDASLIRFKRKCYNKIENCGIQFGNLCSICDKYSFWINGNCSKDCQIIFSDF